MESILHVEQLEKSYGQKKALQDVSFSVAKGSCFGLLGPNGAGKSTTMKIITGVLPFDRGQVTIFGKELKKHRRQIQSQIGYVPQNITLYEKLSAYDNLSFFGEMFGLKGKNLKKRINDLLELTGLTHQAKESVQTYSGGMKRRINIAAALLHQPKLLILDEPTVGIDPQSRNHIFELLRTLQETGITLIYSTHYMEEVEALCDQIAIIDHGRVIAQNSLDGLLTTHGNQAVFVEFTEDTPWINHPFSEVQEKDKGWLVETTDAMETMKLILSHAQKNKQNIKQLEIVRPSLESVFLRLTGTSLRDD